MPVNRPICAVTGGAGFIGSHLVERLLADGYDVRVLDSFVTGSERNLQDVASDPRLSVEECDLADCDDLAAHFSGVETVFHLAARADIVPSIDNPSEYHRANVDGTLRLLEATRAAGVKRLVYAASASCYGIPDSYPTVETADIRPQYPYALTKRVAEEYVLHWGQVYRFPVLSLRLFNVYGTRSRTAGAYGAVMGVFLAQKLAGEPFTVVGDGEQKRDFIFVTDVADAFVLAGSSDRGGSIMNIGASNPQSVNRLVELLGGDVVHLPKRPGEPDVTWADITRATEWLGWRPKVSFEHGTRAMLDKIDYWRDAPVWTPESIDRAVEGWFKYLGDG